MVACYLISILNSQKLNEFEQCGRLWISVIEKFGGKQRGYFLPGEGDNHVGLTIFGFPSLASLDRYGKNSFEDPTGVALNPVGETQCIISDECTIFRLVLSA